MEGAGRNLGVLKASRGLSKLVNTPNTPQQTS